MKFMKQLMIILCISLIAEVMEYLIPLPIAASIYGLVLMLIGLVTKLIPLEKVEGAADFLVELLPILFIPPTVSIMANVEELRALLVPLLVISIVSTVLVMGVTGRVCQGLLRRSRRRVGDTPESGVPEGQSPRGTGDIPVIGAPEGLSGQTGKPGSCLQGNGEVTRCDATNEHMAGEMMGNMTGGMGEEMLETIAGEMAGEEDYHD